MNNIEIIRQESLSIEVTHLWKKFGQRFVLRDVNFSLEWGKGIALFGHNGAGKSTLIRILSSIVRPDGGEVRIGGRTRRNEQKWIRAAVGYVGHNSLLYDQMTGRENLRFYAKLYGVQHLDERIEESLTCVGATSFADERIRTLSNGMQKRISIARALVSNPRLLLLDEPDTGLDEAGLTLISDVIDSQTKSGSSVIISTHETERGLQLADQALVLQEGRVILHAGTKTLVASDIQRMVRGETGANQ